MEGVVIRVEYILVVEDDSALANGLCRALTTPEIQAESCGTLEEASVRLAAWKQGEKPLLLLDVNLPDGNGFDFLKRVKEMYDIPVIMLTANDMETDIVAGLEAGADDYITKPFSLAVLRARVATQLRRVESRDRNGSPIDTEGISGADAGHMAAVSDNTGNENVAGGMTSGNVTVNGAGKNGEGWIADGDYRFHFAKMLFYCGEEQIELSKSEQKLLRILIENRGITLTRDWLLDCIWSVDAAFVDENTLSVTVKRLRDKLGAQERIKTVYGIGYRWE